MTLYLMRPGQPPLIVYQPQALPLAGSVIGFAIGGPVGAQIGGSLGGIASALLFSPKSIRQQIEFRGGERDPHPLRRFMVGRTRTGLAEVFRHVDGDQLRRCHLIASEPIETVEEIWLYGDTHLTPLKADATHDLFDMTKGTEVEEGQSGLPIGNYDDSNFHIAVGLGDQTQLHDFADWIADELPKISNASWKGRSIICTTADFGTPEKAQRRWRGRFPPVEVVAKGGFRYDPNLDSTLSALGGSGSHTRADSSTWAWTRNAAANALHILRARDGLGRANRQILIDDWMDAIDDCAGSSTESTIKAVGDNWKYKVEAPGSTADYSAAGYDDSGWTEAPGGFGTSHVDGEPVGTAVTAGEGKAIWLRHTLPPSSESVKIDFYHDNNATLWVSGVEVASQDSGPSPSVWSGSVTISPSSASRVLAYKVVDAGPDGPGNEIYAGLKISLVSDLLFAADGLVMVDSREADLLGGILSAMGGFLSPSAGKMGVRAGVWKAPTETLSKARVRGFKWTSRSEPTVDAVIATYIDESRGWQPTETRKVLCECSGRRKVSAASYTLVLADASLHVRMSEASAAVTVPPQSSVAWSAFDRLAVEFVNGGTVAAGAGVTLTAPDGLTFVAGEFARLVRTASDAWTVEITTMDRIHPLDLPLVSGGLQATRLAKIEARRRWYNRTIEGVWTGVEYAHRVGDTVSYARDDLPIVDGDYMVVSERLETEQTPGGGMMVLKHMQLREDAEDIYAFDPATEYDIETTDIGSASYTDLDSLLTLDCYQEDYLDSDGGAQARLVGEATIAASGLTAVQVEFNWQYVGDSGWTDLSTASLTLSESTTATAKRDPVSEGESYMLRARVLHADLGDSAWVECGPVTIAAPSATARVLEDGTQRRHEQSGIKRILE